MISLEIIFPVMVVLAIMVGIGGLLTRWIRFEGDVKKALVTILIYVAMPSIILQSIFELAMTQKLLQSMFLMLLLAVIINCLGIAVGWVSQRFTSFSNMKKKELAVLSGLGNNGFIGIPLCAVLFGPEGALLAAIFDAGQDLVVWTLAILMLKQGDGFSWRSFKSLINPPVITIVVGLFAAIGRWRPPQVIDQLTDMLASLTVPLAMIYLGMLLVSLYEKNMSSYIKLVQLPLWSKLLLLPMLVYGSMALMMNEPIALDKSIIQVVMVQSAMPTFTIASVIFAFCQADERLAAVTSVISTAVSFITIPLMLWLGQWLLS